MCEREEGRGRVNREGRIDWGDFIILFLPTPQVFIAHTMPQRDPLTRNS